jgi:hypothetical protein
MGAMFMLQPETLEEIAAFVKSGFYDKDRLMEIFCEEMYEPEELPAEDVSEALDREFQQFEIEKKSWPEVTDCDRVDKAFGAINARGVIALQNAGYTQSDGFDDVSEVLAGTSNKENILGYCFYHGQDLERAIRGGGLYLAFGPFDSKAEETQGPVIGRLISEELERVGLSVVWDGTFQQRIHIPKIIWQRRQNPQA